MKRLITDFCPNLLGEWDYSKNELDPSVLSCGSGRVVWWVCNRGHSWKAEIKGRVSGKGCPYCSGRVVCEDNCLANLRPDIATQWHPTKNHVLTPYDVTCGSNKKVWWLCGVCGYEWRAIINNRARSKAASRCPSCSGKIVSDSNSLLARFPIVASEFDCELSGISAGDVHFGSNKMFHWVCGANHRWVDSPNHRTSKNPSKCPYCRGVRASEGYNLTTEVPELVDEWDFEKNVGISPKDLLPGSEKRVWWLCGRGHSWKTSVAVRTKGHGCPFCDNRRACSDNCLENLRPEIAKEWHPIKNGKLIPGDVTIGSKKRVWWLCEKCGNEWETSVYNRTKVGGTCCGVCAEGSSVSKVSQKWLDSLGIPMENREILLPDLKIRVDAFVPETNTVYEFFGDYWHGNPKRFAFSEWNRTVGRTFGQLYNETKARLFRLEKAGYGIAYIWERDYLGGCDG